MIRQFIRLVIVVFLVSWVAFATSRYTNTPPSLADQLHLSRSKDPIDGGWLPQLTGLPNKEQVVLLTQHVVDVMAADSDTQCTAINLNLRMMIFQHFVIYQHMVNSQNIYFDEQIAHQWAHILAMVLRESSGDSTNITDMSGHSMSTFEAKTDLQNWEQILNLVKQRRIQLNYQTNFGLTQISSDRLFDAFHLAREKRYDTAFLEGREGAETPRKLQLNTAIAIRRLIWFYQDFAQGRIVESNERINQAAINLPAFSTRYKKGLNMALIYCGTNFMFSEKNSQSEAAKMTGLQHAMASIAYCKLGNPHGGYGVNEVDEVCFAEWVTLCPALNIDIASLTPLSYFATRAEKPICENTFKQLINKKPTA